MTTNPTTKGTTMTTATVHATRDDATSWRVQFFIDGDVVRDQDAAGDNAADAIRDAWNIWATFDSAAVAWRDAAGGLGPRAVNRARIGDARRWAGFRQGHVNPTTGTLVVLVDGTAQGLDVADGGRWALMCDDHGLFCQFDRIAEAIDNAPAPWGWCEDCAEMATP